MPTIENCAAHDISHGMNYINPGQNSMLIQITDLDIKAPIPQHTFKEIHHFKFLDIEDNDVAINSDMHISENQAEEILNLLKYAISNDMNVVVHCFAGISRSGAIVEVGSHMGFTPIEKFRSPNTRVMRLMMSKLGIPYEVKPHSWKEDYRKYLLETRC